MAKSSKQQAAANRQNVVEVASGLFRSQGFRATSLPEIMKAASLTHGAFYGQFESKDALAVEAIDAAFSALKQRVDHAAGQNGDALTSMADDYLTPEHRDNPAQGCPVAALAGDVAHEPSGSPLRERFGRDFEAIVQHLSGRAGGPSEQQVLANYALMVGALLLARSTAGRPISEKILAAAKARLTE